MASNVPDNPDKWLSRKGTAAALTEIGLPTSEKTLQTAATRDPTLSYRINGKVAEYQWRVVLAWRMAKVRYRGGTSAAELAPRPI
jgi:hypothetical protein